MPRLTVRPLRGAYFLPKARFVYPTTENWAAIHAVVKPFYDGRLSKKMRGFPPDQVGAVLYQLFHQRHQQLLALRDLEWTKAIHPLRTYCLPGIAQFDVKLQSCSLYSWCPFCWARAISNNIYRKAVTALYFDELKGVWGKPKPIGVLELVQTDQPSYHHAAKAVLGSLKWQRQFGLSDIAGALGGVILTTIEPGDDAWLVRSRMLVLVPAGFQLPATPPGPAIQVEYHESPMRKSRLAAIVGRVCTYPTGLLVGEPELVKQVLDARQHSRLLTSYGVLRNEKNVKRAYELRGHTIPK